MYNFFVSESKLIIYSNRKWIMLIKSINPHFCKSMSAAKTVVTALRS